MGHTKWTDLKEKRRAAMTPEERSRSDAAYAAMRFAFEVGERVRAARERAGLSQRELATRMGTSQAAVARLEAGDVAVTLTMLQNARPQGHGRTPNRRFVSVRMRTFLRTSAWFSRDTTGQ